MTGEARDTGEAGYGNPCSILCWRDSNTKKGSTTLQSAIRYCRKPIPQHVAEESQDHHFIGWPPFPNSEGCTSAIAIESVTSYGESGLDILYRFIAMGATHDSGERFAEPACHPGTRIAGLGATRVQSYGFMALPGWANLPLPKCLRAIAKIVADLEPHSFSNAGDPERGSWHRLFSTLAYQLAYSVSGLLLHVQRAVEANKLVVNQAKELQFQRLIVETLQQAPMPEVLPVLVLDGLDECEDPKIQQNILQLFIDAIHVHQLPIRILIASRPEPHIHGIFQTKATFNICCLVELSRDETAYEDIRKYLHDEFPEFGQNILHTE
ncbi:hypothetical protein B0H14DRAFT_2652618 [Mycena olivaceomarginata]|nr:hypothetical protein B0H14DRAFT_2652618 [Mycena olivaceomarginata]